jgi:hypothetical protein
MTSKLIKHYSPRIKYDLSYSISHPNNKQYVKQLALWGMERINSSAKSYAKKNKGVRDTGKPDKVVTITLADLETIIINSNGKSPCGTDINFAPVGVLRNPGKFEESGIITSEERSRFPSWDRIDSHKGYIPKNVQLTTKSYNLGKSSNNIFTPNQSENKVTLKWNGVELEFNQPTASFLANTLKELVK